MSMVACIQSLLVSDALSDFQGVERSASFSQHLKHEARTLALPEDSVRLSEAFERQRS